MISKKGDLIIIGGHEDKNGDEAILKEVSKRARRRSGHLLITTVATHFPEELAREYRQLFKDLGVERIEVMDIRSREDAKQPANVEKVRGAGLVFFTGGDQLRITSQIGDSDVFTALQEMNEAGMPIVGTSAGAAAMPETMLVSGTSDESNEISALGMAPGLAFIHGVVIDTHFAERGRMGRLLGAVAQNPKNLGMGIDEDTAVIVRNGTDFSVIGSGAVYVLDGTDISYSSLSEQTSEGIVSIFDAKLHVLVDGNRFDLVERRPVMPEMEPEAAGDS
jgi:cyanophycinase